MKYIVWSASIGPYCKLNLSSRSCTGYSHINWHYAKFEVRRSTAL